MFKDIQQFPRRRVQVGNLLAATAMLMLIGLTRRHRVKIW
jgi:hypothetical protein